MGKYREKLDIIADILNVVSRNARKTQIMYQANLNYSVLQKYIAEMAGASLISFEEDKKRYVITEKGCKFLETYREYLKTNKFVERRLTEIDDTKSHLLKLSESN